MNDSDKDPGLPTSCSHCGAEELHSRRVSSYGGHGPYILKGLGRLFHYADFDVVVCANCGFMQFFAEKAAYEQLPHVDWKRIRS
jgi:predicted nucleic-acid-binding Zn-ribbon protein